MSSVAEGMHEQLEARRDRLVERLVLMQAQLGGLYYEMAIRDSVRRDVLDRKAADLQRVDIELAHVERLLSGGDVVPAGECATCGTPHGRADVFCAHCGTPLQRPEERDAS
jgi:hypothetical protein